MAFKLIRDFLYPIGTSYKGEAVLCSFEFGTLAGIAAMPIAERMIDEFESQCLSEGLHMLRLKAWCDTSPILETRFYCEFSCCPASEHSPIPVWVILHIPKIIAAVVAITIAVLFYLSIREIREIFYSPAGPKLAEAIKWFAIGLAIFAGSLLIAEIVKAIPKRAKA